MTIDRGKQGRMADEPYIDDDGEVRELDEQFFATAKSGRPTKPSTELKKPERLTTDADVNEER